MFGGRYIILLMGAFSMYTGFIYNDIFSKSMNLFGGSKWRINYNASTIMENEFLTLDPNDHWLNRTYPLGMDPIWQVAGNNKIIFQNSIKMKIAIIFGVVHMMFGMLIGACNHCHFNEKWSIFTVFMPQMVFLTVLFGYLAALMFIKWTKYSAIRSVPQYHSQCAPSILLTFIEMVLLKSSKSSNATACTGPYMFHWQHEIQRIFIVTAIVCVPWMAFGQPLQRFLTRQRIQRIVQKRTGNGDAEAAISSAEYAMHHSHNPDQRNIEEIVVHSGIQTIEFVLGSISHTASYLRLWALSLAHSRLAEMLWHLVLCQASHIYGHLVAGVCRAIIFAAWSILTIGILVVMEGLSAFLHTLRLHWVEFQSKFYNGQGFAFQPFSFDTVCELANNESR